MFPSRLRTIIEFASLEEGRQQIGWRASHERAALGLVWADRRGGIAPAGVRLLTWPKVHRQALDPQMVQAGQTLFHHDWTPNDPLANGGDGLGPVFNATSCVACHKQPGPGGAGGVEHNVTTFTVLDQTRGTAQTREGVVHAHAVNCPPDTTYHVDSRLPNVARPTLPMLVSLPGIERSRIQFPAGVHLSQRNTPALYGANLIDALPDRVLIANERKQLLKWGLASSKSETLPVGRALRLPDGRIGHFGWKAPACRRSCRPPAPTNSASAIPDRRSHARSANPRISRSPSI